MPDPFKSQLHPVNPLPESGQSKPVPLGRSGADFMRDGYSVYDRADRTDMFQPTLSGGEPVTNDRPTVAWDEEK